MTLERFSPAKIIIYSRDEMKQWEMAQEFKNDPRLRFFIGDVRDRDRLHRACQGVDYIVHAAALKIVPSAEYNPFECIKTNVIGAMNLIDCALDAGVKRVVALSTDKACNPINLYGATKLCSDKLFVSANSYAGTSETRFAVVRYGNVMGSRGSVIPLFRKLAETGELCVTDERMTRFMISLEQGVDLVWLALADCGGGEIYVKKIPSMRVVDIARAIAPEAKITFTGIRPGEKLHEQMISVEDARSTIEYPTHYIILPQIQVTNQRKVDDGMAIGLPEGFSYSSETNAEWMSAEQLNEWMRGEYGKSGERSQAPAVAEMKVSETIILELNQTLHEIPLAQMKVGQVVSYLKTGNDADALAVISELIAASPEVPELYLIRAMTEIRLGMTHEAFRSVMRLMEFRPKHPEGQRMMAQITELLGAKQVLDFT